ncbi:MAG TPA: hypothetical protein VGQ83_00735, partial [Polyangia bacterium]
LIVPPFLVRSMNPEAYGVWALVLQVAAYVTYLDFGIQTAVGRFVAHANERGDGGHRDAIASTSLFALVGSALVGMIALLLLAWQLPNIFRTCPSALAGDARVALILVGGSLALGLPASVCAGIFVGLLRNEVPAAIIAGGKLLGAFALIIIARYHGGLVLMAVGVGAANVLAAALMFWAYRRLASDIRLSPRLVSRTAGKELLGYCVSLTIWSLAMLLIQGLNTTIVGVVDSFGAVAYFTVALTLTNFLAGVQAAIFNALIPAAAILGARADADALGRMLVSTTRYGMLLIVAVAVPLLALANPVLTLWVGSDYARHATPMLQLLLIANIIRLSAVPYAVLLIGTGQQKLVILGPVVEGILTLLASVIGGWRWGALGVTAGMLVGGIAGVTFNFFYNMPRTTGIRFAMSTYYRDGLVRPLVCATPLLIVPVALLVHPQLAPNHRVILTAVGTAAMLSLTWFRGLAPNERARALTLARRLLPGSRPLVPPAPGAVGPAASAQALPPSGGTTTKGASA